MFGFVVIEVMTLSGHPLIINKIALFFMTLLQIMWPSQNKQTLIQFSFVKPLTTQFYMSVSKHR